MLLRHPAMPALAETDTNINAGTHLNMNSAFQADVVHPTNTLPPPEATRTSTMREMQIGNRCYSRTSSHTLGPRYRPTHLSFLFISLRSTPEGQKNFVPDILVPFEWHSYVRTEYLYANFHEVLKLRPKISISPTTRLAGPAKPATKWTRLSGKLPGSTWHPLPKTNKHPNRSCSLFRHEP